MFHLSFVCTNDTMIHYLRVMVCVCASIFTLQSFIQIFANLVEPKYVELPSEHFYF